MAETEEESASSAGTRSSMILMAMATPELAELAVRAGAGTVILDMEHGFLDLGNVKAIAMACRAAGGSCMARVTMGMAPWLGSLADVGVDGVVVSGVRSFAEIDAIAQRLVLFPHGERSINPFVMAAGSPGDLPALRASADGLRIWAMAETAALLEEVRMGGPKRRLKRLTGLMIGPYDLAEELGLKASADESALVRAVGEFADWSSNNGYEWGMFMRDAQAVRSWAGRSIVPRTIIAGYDRDIWFNAVLRHTQCTSGG